MVVAAAVVPSRRPSLAAAIRRCNTSLPPALRMDPALCRCPLVAAVVAVAAAVVAVVAASRRVAAQAVAAQEAEFSANSSLIRRL